MMLFSKVLSCGNDDNESGIINDITGKGLKYEKPINIFAKFVA